MLFIETPANPTLILTDIRACGRLCKEKELLLVVDNTFSSPVVQRPLELGAETSPEFFRDSLFEMLL
ncbi:MAG: PLP-dependent transferase [Clostridiales bacterium]|nr:PLP-dependent transferase [Clostridiales bacterium]